MIIKIFKIFLSLLIVEESSGLLSRNFGWEKNLFDGDECRKERQPVVEYYYKNDMQYLFFSQRVTWVEARILCHSYNSRLAILDTMKKALGVAQSIAESNIVMEDTWLGGRRIDFIWYWVDPVDNDKKEISSKSNIEDFPPWTREPNRPTKECLAIDRRSHEHPNFVDLDCRLQRPFICEKDAGAIITSPIPSKWVRINKNIYTLYHGKVTWQEAAMFCRAQGARLAILKSSIVIHILANSMTKTRPDFETVWIGGHFSYGQWVWMATGSTLNSLTDESGFPPWRFGRPEKNDGCLLLDRHINDNSSFMEVSCDRKRDFVCEEYSDDEDDDWMDDPVKFSYENSTYIIYSSPMTWMKSQTFCSERGSVLAHVNDMDAINQIIEAMGDHPREISHVWLGGQYDGKFGVWRWTGNDQIIPKNIDEFGFPPWINIEDDNVNESNNLLCLNLDRSDHVKSYFYGLDCHTEQSFVCKITCDIPPTIENGTWNCHNVAGGRQCLLRCNKDLILMGIGNITCTFKNGWMSGQDLMEFPLCLKSQEYTSRLVRALGQDIQKSSGYYVILDHSLSMMKSLSVRFAEQLFSAFPMSNNLKSGLAAYVCDPPIHMSLNQTDSCAILSMMYYVEKKIGENSETQVELNEIYNDLAMYNGRRITIIAIIDFARGIQYAEALTLFKRAGHHIIIIGLRHDWEKLLPLATIGFDRRVNLFLFDENELKFVIEEFPKNRRQLKCYDRKNSTRHDYMIYKDNQPNIYLSIIYEGNKSTTVNTGTTISYSPLDHNPDVIKTVFYDSKVQLSSSSNTLSRANRINNHEYDDTNPESSSDATNAPLTPDEYINKDFGKPIESEQSDQDSK